MRPIPTMCRAALVLACSAVFAGAAFAGDKPKDDAPGNSGNAPGQQQKAEQPKPEEQKAPPGQAKKSEQQAQQTAPAAQKTPPGQAKKAEQQAKKAQKQAAKADTKAAKQAAKSAKAKPEQAKGSGSYKATSSGTDLKKGMDHKHTICHATGSSSNPFVVITPSVSGVFNGHMGHQGGEDIIPPFTYKGQTYSQNWDAEGQALFANGCRPAAAAATTTTATTTGTTTTTTTTSSECPPATVTVTDIVPGGVFHKTGSKTNPYVFIRPAKNSAHYTKHAEDIIRPDEEVTKTITVAGSCETSTTTLAGETTTVTQQSETVTIAGSTVTVPGSTVTIAGSTATVGSETTTTTEEAGGVLGAQSPPGAGGEAGAGDEDAGGVLDAVASLGDTATSGTLPFTGIPLWLAALAGAALIAAGLTLRRTT